MQEELSWQEKIVYPLLIALGTVLLIYATPMAPWRVPWSMPCALAAASDAHALLSPAFLKTLRIFLNLHTLLLNRETFIFTLIFAALCFLLHLKKMALRILKTPLRKKTRGGSVKWIMDEIILYAALFLKGVGVAAWVIALASFSFQVYLLHSAIKKRIKKGKRFIIIEKKRKISDKFRKGKPFPLGQVLYGFTSPFNRVTMIVPAGILYECINRGSPLGSWTNIAAVLAMFFVYFTIATFISALTIMLRERRPRRYFPVIWWEMYSDPSIYIFMLCPLGLLFALIYQREPLALVLILVPLYAMHRAMKNIERIIEDCEQFIISLANALDARDHYTYGHSDRVARYSKTIAKEMGLSPQKVEAIERAGQIHDLGKIGIPDAILRKQGKLDDNEYAIMKGHALAIKDLFEGKKKLLEKIPVELAYSHHERFDGKGYAYGKRGDEIPLGARILSIADTFDALTTDRPYRKGMNPEKALSCIKDASGTQFDPSVVEVFARLFARGDIAEVLEKKQ
ncbi:MAG: HD-GYP domain-containing protein [Candidatus Eremiobacteraeota bacterium]|nr:HD-GYP domain-containing protein [Candidatus Eremiobacteraeota bacterium]